MADFSFEAPPSAPAQGPRGWRSWLVGKGIAKNEQQAEYEALVFAIVIGIIALWIAFGSGTGVPKTPPGDIIQVAGPNDRTNQP